MSVLGGFELVEDVAKEIGVSPSTLHEWIRQGRFPARRPAGTRRYLIPADELAAWLDGCEMETKVLADGGRVVRPKRKGGTR